ncbi:MAG: DUF342 domain-containing protein, partial [Planctomycetes bacterium]|nr:DUF342 domain-containing protein [Planctomycetota bacterium]
TTTTTTNPKQAALMPFDFKVDETLMHAQLQRVENIPLGELTAEVVLSEMRDKKLRVDAEAERTVGEAVAIWRSNPESCPPIVVVKGLPPEHGQDGRLVWAPGRDPTRRAAQFQEDQADHYASQLISVGVNDLIATVIPPTDGKPGVNVHGAEIPAKNGSVAEVKIGDGCHLEDETGQIVSDLFGTLKSDGKAISVTEGLHITENVDFSTGHVTSPGDVLVDGYVADLFQITSGGSVTIRKDVNAAEIRAAKDVTVGGCLVNHRKGICLAGGDITLRLVDNSIVAAHGSIRIARQALSSDIFAGGVVECTAGTISGGVVAGRGGVTAKVIGSPAASTIMVLAGVDWMLKAVTSAAMVQLEEIGAVIADRLPTVRAFKANSLQRLTTTQRERLAELGRELKGLFSEREELTAAVAAAHKESEEACQATVTVTGQIHAGVEMRLGNWATRIDRPMKGHLTFSVANILNERVIIAKTANGNTSTFRTWNLAEPLQNVKLPEMPPARPDDDEEAV